MTEAENPTVLFLCVGLTVGFLIIILLICMWCHSRKKRDVPSSQTVAVTASERAHSPIRNPPDLVTESTRQYVPDNRWQTAMETLLMRDGPNDRSGQSGSPNTRQSNFPRGTRQPEQFNAFRQNSIDPPSYESLQNIPTDTNNIAECSNKDSHIGSTTDHQAATSSTEAGNENIVYEPADYEPPPPEYGTVVLYKDIYSVTDD